jgi:hypothetical protein
MKFEKEFVTVKEVDMLHGTAVQLKMVISLGKFVALQNALTHHDSCVGKDLLAMINRAIPPELQ